ncbi:hypothetical protein KL905_002847 [Ogataea polymorpha]|nr:hypothetical protein KL937_002405 [Ogataea polymorpha]KAG7893268.1 hypothetical protein KL908_003001 [Ogataea polymorpha]KAG7900705.1 hypothetical protein KL935_002638 [Ogataea polymorpha]KAG7907898.1 hypothetical protein KL906_003315 [Ogataea polymorpha]KAG7916482.1 hypothetical protein KL927_003121 [Ogataea polymorpha]
MRNLNYDARLRDSDTPHLRGSNYRAVFRGSGWGLERKFNTDQNSLGPLGWRSPQKSSGAHCADYAT